MSGEKRTGRESQVSKVKEILEQAKKDSVEGPSDEQRGVKVTLINSSKAVDWVASQVTYNDDGIQMGDRFILWDDVENIEESVVRFAEHL